MPTKARIKTKFPGVFFVLSKSLGSKKQEKVYYILYRKEGKLIEEKAGRAGQDDMTPSRAAAIRALRIERKQTTNKERRLAARQTKWTLQELWAEYLRTKPDLKGMATDHNRFSLHISPTMGNKEPKELAPLDLDRLRIGLSKNYAPATVKNVLELLRRIINFGVKKRIIPRPDLVFEMPKVNNLKTEDLTAEQLKALLDAIDADPHPQAGPMMKAALVTGMRRSELYRLKWADVDFHRGQIFIRDPKGGVDQQIPMNDAARELLQKHVRTGEYVFSGPNGNKLVEIKKAINQIREKAGLPKDFRPLHGLRHCFACGLAASGQVDLFTIQKLLTHKSPQMTMRYAHLRDAGLRKASNVAGDIITRAAIEGAEAKIIQMERPTEPGIPAKPETDKGSR